MIQDQEQTGELDQSNSSLDYVVVATGENKEAKLFNTLKPLTDDYFKFE